MIYYPFFFFNSSNDELASPGYIINHVMDEGLKKKKGLHLYIVRQSGLHN